MASILQPLEDAELASWAGFSSTDLEKLIDTMDKYTAVLKQQLG